MCGHNSDSENKSSPLPLTLQMRKLGPREWEWQPQSRHLELDPDSRHCTATFNWVCSWSPLQGTCQPLLWADSLCAFKIWILKMFCKCLQCLHFIMLGFPCGGILSTKGQFGRTGQTLPGPVMERDHFFLTPKWDLHAEKGYFLLSYNFDKKL